MKTELDCRGLDCPAPVLQIKEILEKGIPASITVLVDNEAAWQNVSRFMESQNFQITTERQGADFRVVGTRENGGSGSVPDKEAAVKKRKTGARKILVLIGGLTA